MFEWLKKKPKTGSRPEAAPSVVKDSHNANPPIGSWSRISLPQMGTIIAFVYVDPEAGVSAKGGPDGSDVANASLMTVRWPVSSPWVALNDEECRARSLPAVPLWLQSYGPQPLPNPPWRSDPLLRGRFVDGYPDDLQVLVHDGEPRRTGIQPEACFVQIIGSEPGPSRNLTYMAEVAKVSETDFSKQHQNNGLVYVAKLLNAPHHLKTLQKGDTLRVLAGGWRHPPIHVTPEYLAERALWRIQPCSLCSFSECLDPPSTMIPTRFPDTQGAENLRRDKERFFIDEPMQQHV